MGWFLVAEKERVKIEKKYNKFGGFVVNTNGKRRHT